MEQSWDEIEEIPTCGWCLSTKPFSYNPWIIVDYEDGLGSLDRVHRFCCPLHVSYYFQSLGDEKTNPPETIRDLLVLQIVLDKMREINGQEQDSH
jgi:hypothetical protein